MMVTDNEYDVAIVGYGPTGVTAANLLGAEGLRVLVVERDAEVFSRARAISTDEEVMRIWQRIGLAEQLKQDMLAELPLEFVDAAGRSFISAVPTPRGHGHPPQLFLYQPALEADLRAGVDRYPNVEIRLETECVRLMSDKDGVELTLAGVEDDTVNRIRVTYVIAADGGSSPIRSQLNVGYEGRTYEDRWVVIDTKMLTPWPAHDRLRFHCDPARPAVDCPTPLGHHRWEFPILPGEDEDYLVSHAAIWTMLARYGIDDTNVEILRATVYSHHVRFAARWRVGRVFLAGDAAHAMPPWIGQGMAAGIRDAANLCWKLAAVIRGELPEHVLDTYEQERQPHVRDITKRAVFVGRIITERHAAVTVVRNTALRALARFKRLNQRLQDASWIPVARYRAGLLADGGGTGLMVLQPFVLDASGQRVLLDDALGAGWLQLHANPTPAPSTWAVPSVRVLPAGSKSKAGCVVDVDNLLLPWMKRHRIDTALLRPDRYIYATASKTSPLPSPPNGFVPAPLSAVPSAAHHE